MRRILLAATALSALAGAPLFAAAYYIPISVNENVAGRDYVTRVWVSNPTGQTHEFSKHFIASGDDGTVAERNGDKVSVLSGGTFLIGGDAPLGAAGMLEIDADPELVITSELVPSDNGVPGARVRIPAVSGLNMISAGGAGDLLGLERMSEAGTSSNLGLITLGKEPTECSAKALEADGDQIGGTVFLNLPPLSHVEFDAVLALLGLEDTGNIRVQFSCDQDFYTYATIFGTEAAETLFIAPAVAGSNSLRVPGDEDPAINLFADGDFLVATSSDPYRLFEFPVAQGVNLSHIEVDFDFFLGRFNTNLFHTITSMRSGGLYYAISVRGSNSRTFLETPNQQVTQDGPWQPGHTYHVHIVYDVVANSAVLEVSEFEVLIQTVSARANRSTLTNVDGTLRLDFSQERVFDNAFFPLWGSIFSNLEAQGFPLVP